jgi:hypothetical protein
MEEKMKKNIEDNPDIILKDSKGLHDTYENTKTGEQFHVLGEVAFINNEVDYTKKVKIEVIWTSDMPIKRQLVKLIKICPELTKLSRTEILEKVKKESTFLHQARSG